jgi:Nitrate reductase delta subunit
MTANGSKTLLAQAAAWRMAALLLERPRCTWQSEITALATEIAEQQLRSAAGESGEATEELYQSLFGPGGSVSPREVTYCGMEDPGRIMAELAAWYTAFAFAPRVEECADHICVEAGFVGYLLLKQAYTHMQGDLDSEQLVEQAKNRFIKQHLNRSAQGILTRSAELPAYMQTVLSWLAAHGCQDQMEVL